MEQLTYWLYSLMDVLEKDVQKKICTTIDLGICVQIHPGSKQLSLCCL